MTLQLTSARALAETPRLAPLIGSEEAWKVLPPPHSGAGQPLPVWARMLATELPRSTAALLELDLAQRTKSPLPPQLRAGMRWVAANANRCDYARAVAAFDAKAAGASPERLAGLDRPGYPGWSPEERAALQFAFKMTVDSDSVTDEEFAALVKHFGERQAASMVLVMAYSNFQDRLLLCLGATIEAENGPLPPVDVKFPPESFLARTTPPPTTAPPKATLAEPNGKSVVKIGADWSSVTYDILQERLAEQRAKPTRLRIPEWEEVAKNLPEGPMRRHSDIIWYRIVFGYAPELAVPYEVFMRTAGAETSPRSDRIFAGSLFWVVTRGVDCPYCMGHCEMNWEVAGLTQGDIAQRSRLLAGDDWSSFPPEQQRAFAFARKLTAQPWTIAAADIETLQKDFPDRALVIALHTSRYHYMVRISNGFQLKLESENVFFDYWNIKAPQKAAGEKKSAYVPLPSDEEAWKLLPKTASGGGGPLPNWARATATLLPRTAAAMLELDLAHRTASPLDPVVRGKMRWVIANANHCEYSKAYALADLARSGVPQSELDVLTGSPLNWPEGDRDALEFARLLSVAAPTIPDELFEKLRVKHGDRQVAAMVLLAAYGNFQDRFVLGLNLPMESSGPLPPVDVKFVEGAVQIAPLMPPQPSGESYVEGGKDVVGDDQEWSSISYEQLQAKLEAQRDRKPRLPTPNWDDVKVHLPGPMAARPTRIVWSLTCLGYVPELAVPWSIATRTLWAECPNDRIFEESLFWIQTRAVGCNYCMGHCEMLLEVAGLDQKQIAHRTALLAGADWSAFPPKEQRAYDYARKLSRTPWQLTEADYRALEQDLGEKEALSVYWWLCRGLYMTRVSDGFQLPLERDNVFHAYAPTEPEKK